jgi:hypothetical protein
MRLAPISGLSGSLLDFSGSTDTARYNIGAFLDAAPTDGLDTTTSVPNWGQCELLYVRSTSGSVINPGRLVTIDKDYTIADLANTAGLGYPVFVALTRFAIGSTTAQYGWVLAAGICPVQYAVAATTGALGIGGAGQATPTLAAGKQILNGRCLIAASGSFARSVTTSNGSAFVKVSRTNGVFVGQAVSGTGIPASSVVSSIDASGTGFVIGSAIGTPVNATASGTVTGTFTHTNYGIVQMNRAFAQGQIL